MWWYGGPWTGMMGSWWWGWHMLVPVLFWVGIAALSVVAMQKFASSRRVGGTSVSESVSPAIAILQERYARGEIGRDEYMEKQRDLKVSTAP